MIQGCLGYLLSAQHPCNFLMSIFLAQRPDDRARSTIRNVFGNAVMIPAEFSYLRQMRNTEDLVMLAQLR